MADDVELFQSRFSELFISSDDFLTNQVKNLFLADDGRTEDNRILVKTLEVLCDLIAEREDEILHCEQEDEEFFAMLIVIAGHRMGEMYDACGAFTETALEAAEVIFAFCLDRIKNERENSLISQIIYVKILDGICHGQEGLGSAKLMAISQAYSSIKPPLSLKDYKFQRKFQTGQFNLVFASCATPAQTDDFSLKQQKLSSDWQEQFRNNCHQTMRKLGAGLILLNFATNLPFLQLFNCYFKKKALQKKDTALPTVSMECIVQFSDEFGIINRIAGMHNVVGVNFEQLHLLSTVVCTSFKAALFVAMGCYEVAGSDASKISTAKQDSVSVEDSCRKFAWRATETCLAVFRTVLNNIHLSSHFSGSVYHNLQAIAADTLLHGFDLALKNVKSDSSEVSSKEVCRKWKWFSGLNIMLVTMASKVVMLVSTLADSLYLEDRPLAEEVDGGPVIDDLKIDTQCSAWQRMKWLLSKNNIPAQLWELFRASYSMASNIQGIKDVQAQEKAEREEEQAEIHDSAKTSSSEEGSEEEGSLFGKWLENILSESVKSKSEPKESKGDESKSESAYTQSLDIFVLLASSLLDLCIKFFPTCLKYKFGDAVRRNFNDEGIKSLGETIKEVDRTVDELASREDLSYYMHQYITMLQSSGIIEREKLELLLSELNVQSSDEKEWPLHIPKLSLSLFGRLALSEQDLCLRSGYDSANTPRVMVSWNKLLRRLAKRDAERIDVFTPDLNVEHLQLLALLYVNLPKADKIHLTRACFEKFVEIGEENPLSFSRLILIADYLLRGFSETPRQIFQQVVKNILTLSPKADESSPVEFTHCMFKEEEIYRNSINKIKMSDTQRSLIPKQPRFYELLPEDFTQRLSDSAILQAFTPSHMTGKADLSKQAYESFYSSLLSHCNNLLTFIELNRSKDKEILQVMAARSGFLHLWKLFLSLPVPLSLLEDIVTPEKVLKSPEMTLFFLRIMPTIFTKLKNPNYEVAKELLIFDEYCTEKATTVIKEVIEKCCKTSYICQLASMACLDASAEQSYDGQNWQSLLLADGMMSLLLVLFQRFVIDQEIEEGDDVVIAKLASVLLKNIVVCRQIIKSAIISQQSEKPSEEILAVYGKLVGVQTSHLSKDIGEVDFSNGLPNEIKDATEKWKEILLTQFPMPKPKSESSDGLDDIDFPRFISSLLGAHVTVYVTGSTLSGPACTVKHLLQTLIDLMQLVLSCLKSRSEEQFQQIQVDVITTFIHIIADSTVDHVFETANRILESAIGSSDGDKIQEILHAHQLSLSFFVVYAEIDHEESFITNEQTVLQCLEYIETLLQRSVESMSAASYFNTVYHLKLASILLSIRLSKFSHTYASKVLQLFSNVLMSADSIQQTVVRQAIVEVFSSDSVILEVVLTCMVTSGVASGSSSNKNIMALQKFVNCVIQEKNDLTSVLDTAIAVYEKLIYLHIGSAQEKQNVPYGDFLDILINFASAVGAEGHVQLLKSVVEWIDVSGVALLDNLQLAASDSVTADEGIMTCITSLLRYVIMILTAMKRFCGKESESIDIHGLAETELGGKDKIDHDVDDDVNTEDEDTAGEESDEESLGNKLCSFTVTQRDFMNQHWYHCHTCNMNDGVGCCTVCAKVCHKDHDVTYAKYGSFFCDCGAKDDGSCKAMTKRATVTGSSDRGAKPVSPFAAWSSEKSTSEHKHHGSALETKGSSKKGKNVEKKVTTDNWYEDSSFINLLSSLLEDSKMEIFDILNKKKCLENYVLLLKEVYKYQEQEGEKQKGDFANSTDLQNVLRKLYNDEKDMQSSDQLMIPILGSQEGAFESVRLKFSGEQGQTIRQLINAHVLRHTAMCLMASQNGRRQHLAVTHEKGKITILQLSGLLKQPDTASRKLTLNRLSSTTLPFTVISINSNPENEDVLAVCGLKDCHVITYGHAGSVATHLVLPLQLETGNFVIKAVWVPGSPNELALLTADFVKVYDLSKSVASPTHHFILPGGKVRDATFIHDGSDSRIAVMSSHGHIYTEIVNEATSASGGPFFLTNVISVVNSNLKDNNGQIAGGGVSLYYSHVLKLLFFSYVQGKSFVGVLKEDFSEMKNVFQITSAVANHASLCNWNEIVGQPGLLHCVNQTSGNPVMVMVKPDRILIQEVKTTPSKSKIQDAVCYYHLFPVTRNSDTTIQQKTIMIVLLEDGSLRIYNANKEETNYWLQPQFKPKNFVHARHITKKGKTSRQTSPANHASSTQFPIDFFEHSQQTNDIEFGGADILHVYNSVQVKTRLNSAGMYIANTKPSGFKIEISNTNTSTVMVGVRLHVGVRSVEKTPTYVEVFGRIVPFRLSRNRWFDIPFSRTESLSADKKFTLTFGPSADSSGISMVDSIKVYSKTKETFGWPEDVPEPPPRSPDPSHDARALSGATDAVEKTELSTTETLLGKALETLIEHIACFTMKNDDVYDELLSFTTRLVISKTPLPIQSKAKALMASLFSSKNDFFDKKDETQLFHSLNQFQAANSADELVIGPSYAELVLEVLNVARTIGNARPNNLIRLLKDFDKDKNTLDLLMTSFWNIYSMRPVNYFLAPISTRAIGTLDGTIEALVEVLFAVLLGDAENFQRLAEIIISLLLNKDSSVSFAAKRGISQALQLRRKVTVVKDCSPMVEEIPTEQVTNPSEIPEETTPQPDEMEIMPDSSYAEVETEEIEQQQNGLQVYLGGDESVIELAIALSLQDQENDNDDDDDNDEEDDADFEDDTDGPLPDELEDSVLQDDSQLMAGDSLSLTCEESTLFRDEQDSPGEKPKGKTLAKDGEKSSQSSTKHKQTVIEITDSALQASWQKLFAVFIQHLPDLKDVDGMQAIPYLQVLLMLCSNLSDSEADKNNLEKVVFTCLKLLDQTEEGFNDISERASKKEMQLVIIRFFSVLMSQSKSAKESQQADETKSMKSKLKPSKTVAKILANEGILAYCLSVLKNLLNFWRNLKDSSMDDTADEREILLKPNSQHSIPDMSPFFLKQYVKSHANDLFESFPQLVTEMVLRIPYQIRKRLEGVNDFEAKHFGQEWIQCLCEYMIATETPFVRRHVRKLLLALCGSKEQYRRVKDIHTLNSYVDIIRGILGVNSSTERQINFSYEETVKLADNAKACVEIAMVRNGNWQIFCKENPGVLPFLVQASFQLSSEHVSGILLQLIGLAVGSTKQASSNKDEEKEGKTINADDVKALVCKLFEQCYSSLLFSFMKFFLLESNSTSMRWKAHELLHTIFRNISADQQLLLIELMWQLWRFVPSSGHKAAQFIDLLGYITVKTPGANKMMEKYTSTALSLLSHANDLLVNHPNASVYRRLQGLVEVSGFYLENDPCIVCNNPEIPFTHAKLTSIKSDIRYTTTAQFIKLNVNFTISRLLLRMSDIKRAKMVKTINIYYNNKPVPSVVELKNKKNIWQQAKRISLTAEQTDVKVDFTLPIVAYNLMIEYTDFYDNIQLSSESLQCPRCSASVHANPGVCANCGENVYQCHKCRAINYDERDPFLCTSCGFCKYAKFEYTLVTRPCCAVEPVHDESERQKALNSVNNLLESADKIYVQLSGHKQSLEVSLRNVSEESSSSNKVTTTTTSGSTASSAAASTQVNKNIQSIAQKYCLDCKTSFEELSRIIQKVTAIRKELITYDVLQQEALSTIIAASPGASPISQKDSPISFTSPTSSKSLKKLTDPKGAREGIVIGKCYGCALSTAEHCLTILRAIATIKETHDLMLKQDLLHELLEHNLQQRKTQVTSLARKLIIMITKGNPCATDNLNRLIMKQVNLCLESNAANITSDISLQNQMSVLGLSLNTFDQCWDQRLRCVFNLFLDSVQRSNTDVTENVTLPCLRILAESMQQSARAKEDKPDKQATTVPVSVNASKWLDGSTQYSMQPKSKQPSRTEYLSRKYASIWMNKVQVKKTQKRTSDINGETWLRLLLFSRSSRAVRETVCGVLENLCKTDNKKEKLLQLFTRYLENLHEAGESASDFLNFFKLLIKPAKWKRHLVAFGILEKLTELIIKEVEYLSSLENKTIGFDLSQGFALHALADILKLFFEDDVVKWNFKSKFVGCVLQCYLSLRRLVVQRTKLIDAAQDILLTLLEQLTTGTEAEERSFMKICLEALNEYPVMDIRTPVFIYERLCNIIYKEEKEVNEFFIIIEKDPQQEDFLQGRMPGNPYSCKEVGLGPLMRDIKNKICTECELVALLEDDTGMELLVNNKIISLDLPVADVYKKIWCAKGERQEAMKIVYRMRGLLGDATEDMVDDLNSDKDKDIDEEYEYRQAAVIAEVGGLDIILKRLSYIRDLSRAQDLIFVMLKLLEYCVKVKVNRQYLGNPSANALKIMLGTLNLALRLEKEKGSGSGGAMIAEKLLNIMGIVLHEASAHAEQYQIPSLPGEESQLELLLGHITSPYVRANANVLEAMMRLIPSLSFASEQSMHTLIDHFLPYLEFNRFDEERSPDETLYLDCFCVIASGISNTVSGSILKGLINDSGIPKQALDYLIEHTPPKSFSASGILDANRWKELLGRPAVPYVLKILTGLVTGHSATQDLVGTEDNIALLHRLEQVSSEENVGSLAENLIEALRENPEVAKRVHAVRRQTREDKKKMALAMRQKQLEALGMLVTDKGQIKAKPSSVIKEMEDLLEEKGLICCICREGYKFHPKKVLAVYTYTTRCVLDEFENKQRKTQGYTTVSHFNVVHVDCHKEAIRHARSRDEWESAALQNANTRCNGLMPIWGPKVSESAFATCLARHNGYLQECTGFREPTFHSTIHDLKLLLLRFAHERSFSDEAGGGGRISNMYLFPYMANTALYVFNTTRLHLTEEKIMKIFLEAPVERWRESATEVDGPLFVTTLSLFTVPLAEWKEKRVFFLRRLLVLAHARSFTPTATKKWPDENPVKQFSVYKPVLLFFELINQFHLIFKNKLKPDESDWTQSVCAYLRNKDEVILKAVEKLLSFYEKDLLPCESLEEFFDVAGLLGEVEDPKGFLVESLKMAQGAEKA